jgi:hypothetical protein
MTNSSDITKWGWQLFVALRVGFIVLTFVGIALVVAGYLWGFFFFMFGAVLGSAAASRRCEACRDHLGWVGPSWFGFVNPLARKCQQCGHPVRKPG